MPDFLNPYHFVPLKPRDTGADPDIRNLEDLLFARHDTYRNEAHSGRLICRLTTTSPLVVGAQQDDAVPKNVEPYRLDEEVAIPATSLKGVISSVAEAASNSAMRVVEDRTLSYRQPLGQSLSALGMLFSDRDKWWLIPLTLPTLRKPTNQREQPWRLERDLQPYQNLYDHAALRVHFGDTAANIPEWPPIWDVNQENFKLRSFRLGDPVHGYVWGMPLAPRRPIQDGTIPTDNLLHIKRGDPNDDRAQDFLIGQHYREGVNKWIFPWHRLPPAERPAYIPGILRVLGGWGRDMPPTRKHELFLPLPQSMLHFDPNTGLLLRPDLNTISRKIEVTPQALERFYALADERTDAVKDRDEPILPYEPRDTRPARGRDRLRFKDGDIVYFRAARQGNQVVATEVSFSANWRSRVEKSDSQKAIRLREFIPPALTPSHAGRPKLTPVDLLLGFVEEQKAEPNQTTAGNNSPSRALAGRVRFSAARLPHPPANRDFALLPPYTLKIQGTPKPPCPALYFREKTGPPAYIPKDSLSLAHHTIQGRKFYLHAAQNQIHNKIGETRITTDNGEFRASLQQKVSVQPIASNQAFWFHLDYDNLSPEEFGLLLYSLEPTGEFQHKLGMGKALGLGSIRIEVMAVLEVERHMRYSPAGFHSDRYHKVWRKTLPPCDRPLLYQQIWDCAVTTGFDPITIRDSYRHSMNPVIRRALEQIGAPRANRDPSVSPPLTEEAWKDADPRQREAKTYEWFVSNASAKQFLKPLDTQDASAVDSIRIEPLSTNKKPRKR